MSAASASHTSSRPAKPPPAVSSGAKMPATEAVTTHPAPPATTKKGTSSSKPSPTSAHPQTTEHQPTTPRPSPSPSPPGNAPKVNNASTPSSSPRPSSVEPSRPASTITSVTFVNGALQTTVTAHPNSTFASPVSITALNSLGNPVLTAPPLVTIMSTSILSNGQMSTVTQIVANPVDGLGRVNAVENNGFFHNSGVVAGVFTAVGVVAAAVLATLIFCIRRKRRSQRRKRWLAGMKPQRTYPQEDPFQDPMDNYEQKSPTIASMNDGTRSDGHAPLIPHRMSVQDYSNVMGEKGNFMLYPDPYPLFNPDMMIRPRAAQTQHGMHDIDLGHGHAHLQLPVPSPFGRSYAPSTPSIYPASLPGESDVAVAGHEADNLNSFNHEPKQTQAPGKRDLHVAPTIVVPPRPPRSQLRESARNVEFAPLTPPDSVASNSLSSKPPSPISPVTESYPRDVLTRRTLLDVSTY
ncbi:hypothetical protein D9619_003557 [Psilocybe cf. subviscida]|uniref:Uncharacterized protein n=1 Tax=Psilocybe cf. subviscida TaxID=2480587 RepID=A0A8H5AY15_9AGAR|nr:hypothetical protein D9619_003557 [Psilocybe cf. subviscida]